MEPYFFISAVYDPDPIASLRRRRISTDSQDSGQSHHAAALAAEAARFGGGNTSCSSAEESTASHHKDRYGVPPYLPSCTRKKLCGSGSVSKMVFLVEF
jgi:hypothetical protein